MCPQFDSGGRHMFFAPVHRPRRRLRPTQQAMNIRATEFPGLCFVQMDIHRDSRGLFCELFRRSSFLDAGLGAEFLQDNLSVSPTSGTLRGMHYQLEPFAQAKLIGVLSGAVTDIVIDLRKGSPTFGQWHRCELADDSNELLFVPRGFAHGFCTREDNTMIWYKVDNYYRREAERTFRWDDPELALEWPVEHPILSERDCTAPTLAHAEHNFEFRGGS